MYLAHEEFLDTEKHYIEDLKALAELSKAVPAFGTMPAGSSAAIFLNIQEILQCNETFLTRSMGDDCSVSQLARAFILCRQEMIRVYRPYILRHDNAMQVLQAHENDSAFQKVVKTFLTTMGRQSLPNLLIKPVQRICRYPLLFAQIAESMSTTVDSDLRTILQTALDCSLAVCSAVEDQVTNSPRVDPMMQKLFRSMHKQNFGQETRTRKLSFSETPIPVSFPKQPPPESTRSEETPSPPDLGVSPLLPKSRTNPELHSSTVLSSLRHSGGKRAHRRYLLQEMARLTSELARIQRDLSEACL